MLFSKVRVKQAGPRTLTGDGGHRSSDAALNSGPLGRHGLGPQSETEGPGGARELYLSEGSRQ